jgi:hypothetical protein
MAAVIQEVEGRGETVSDAERERLQRRVQDTAHPCGCRAGAMLSLAALVGWPMWTLAAHPPGSVLSLVLAVPLYLAVVVGAGVAGKIAGIAVGHRHHRRLRRRLAALTRSAQAQSALHSRAARVTSGHAHR